MPGCARAPHQRGAKRFAEELVARVRRAGATGPLTLRADAGFYNWDLIDTLTRLGGRLVDHREHQHQQVKAAIDAIDEDGWTDIVYPDGGHAQVAETIYVTGGDHSQRPERRVRLSCAAPGSPTPPKRSCGPTGGTTPSSPTSTCPTVDADQFHRDHATVELAIRDLKEGAGLEHCPSGRFFANAAWLACAVLAHNLIRWTARLGGVHPDDQLTVARTIRTRLLALPGRLVNRSRRWTLRLPARWPWAHHSPSRSTRSAHCPSSPDQPPADQRGRSTTTTR